MQNWKQYLVLALLLGAFIFSNCQNSKANVQPGRLEATYYGYYFYQNGIKHQNSKGEWEFWEYSKFYNPSNLPSVAELYVEKNVAGYFLVRKNGGDQGGDSWCKLDE